MAVTNQARQSQRPSIDEWHAPATIIHAKDGIFGSYTQIAPQCNLETARDGIALYRCNNWLAQKHFRHTQWTITVFAHLQIALLIKQGGKVETGAERDR